MKIINFFIFLFLNTFLISQNSVLIKGNVINSEDKEGVENALIVLKLEGGYIFEQKSDSTGKYQFDFSIASPKTFTISIYTDKHTKSKRNKDCGFLVTKETGTGELQFKTEYIKDFYLTKVYDCGSRMSSFVFNTNSIICCNDSLNKIDSTRYDSFNYAINSLIKTLKENPTIIIEFQGHASSIEKNPELIALYRTQLIKEILISKGINGKRIMIKSWGNKKLLIKDDLIKNAKTKEDKLALHQKNQRVLCRIISWDFKE